MHLSVAQLRLQASIYFFFVFGQLLNSDCSVSVSVSLLVELSPSSNTSNGKRSVEEECDVSRDMGNAQ